MSSFSSLSPGDIVSIRIDGRRGGDLIVISKNTFHASGNFIVGVLIIDDVRHNLSYTLQINPRDLESCRLNDTSQVRLDKISTVHTRNIIEKKGNVTGSFLLQMTGILKNDVLQL